MTVFWLYKNCSWIWPWYSFDMLESLALSFKLDVSNESSSRFITIYMSGWLLVFGKWICICQNLAEMVCQDISGGFVYKFFTPWFSDVCRHGSVLMSFQGKIIIRPNQFFMDANIFSYLGPKTFRFQGLKSLLGKSLRVFYGSFAVILQN